MLSSLQFAHVLAHARATNAGMALGAHVVAKRHHHLLDLLENGNAEGSSFSSSRLRLRNHIEALDAGHDGSPLDRAGLLKTVGINTSQQLLFQLHVVEVLAYLVPIGFNEAIWVHSCGSIISTSRLFLRTIRVPLILISWF